MDSRLLLAGMTSEARFLPETPRNDIMKDGFPIMNVENDKRSDDRYIPLRPPLLRGKFYLWLCRFLKKLLGFLQLREIGVGVIPDVQKGGIGFTSRLDMSQLACRPCQAED